MPFQFRKEAIEEDLNSNFPSQGQGNPPLYYSLSEVVVPTYSINSVAEGSGLPENLQTAWDFSTSATQTVNTTSTIITNPGFWRISVISVCSDATESGATPRLISRMFLDDTVSTKNIWGWTTGINTTSALTESVTTDDLYVFVNTGQSVKVFADNATATDTITRQIATVNGELINPLGFSFA